MHSSNPFVAGLSLTTVGNLATPDIARDLMMEVEKHLRGGRPYLVKKVPYLCNALFDTDDWRSGRFFGEQIDSIAACMVRWRRFSSEALKFFSSPGPRLYVNCAFFPVSQGRGLGCHTETLSFS